MGTVRQPLTNAMIDVVFEHGEADPVQRRFSCGQLLQDLNARPRFLDHPADASDLAFDAIQTTNEGVLILGFELGLTGRWIRGR